MRGLVRATWARMRPPTVTALAWLIVGPRGQVTGQVSARRIEVSGQTHDTLVASERLVVRSTGVVRGTVRYGELETERGGVIAGMVARGPEAD